jgi:hypothetical protein
MLLFILYQISTLFLKKVSCVEQGFQFNNFSKECGGPCRKLDSLLCYFQQIVDRDFHKIFKDARQR